MQGRFDQNTCRFIVGLLALLLLCYRADTHLRPLNVKIHVTFLFEDNDKNFPTSSTSFQSGNHTMYQFVVH